MSTVNELILPRSDIMLSATNDVSEICSPLRRFGITAFSHTRVYSDNTFIDMADNPEMPDYFYYKTDIYKHYSPDLDPGAIGTGFFLCSNLGENEATQALREDLNI
ncbi:MAG: hypothetical protein HRU43_07235 [Simkaniaceae bacterium]|nr:hypothetical protein [Simkaniaceae bacterium]